MGNLSGRLYLSSPVWVQQAAVAVFGYWWYRRRFGGRFSELVSEFKSRESWRASQFEELQRERLGRLFAAARRSPYYRELFTEAGLDAAHRDPVADLGRLPPLTKDVLRTRPKDLLTRDPRRADLVLKSSGTTGTPTEIHYPPEFHQLGLAVPEARNLSWAGVGHQDKRVMFGVRKVCRFDQGRPPFWRFSPVEKLAYASIYHLNEANLVHYIEFLRGFEPRVIMGYPSALNVIAKYALDHGDYPAPARAVVTTSETVTEQARARIEAAWRCKLFDRYGAVEGCLFASQCEFGSYHVSPEVGIIEILDSTGNPAPPGVTGEVVCTGLYNELQPLIRYRIGDVARWAVDQSCACGRDMPVLEAIQGRFEDICILPDGREMLRFDPVFKGVETIREAQVVQVRPDRFVIRVVPADGFEESDLSRMKANMELHAGAVDVQVCEVDKIERTSSGKFRAVICELSDAEKDRIRNLARAAPKATGRPE